MKIKNKGKVHPSPSSSASTTTTSSSDPIVSTLQLLPASVLALASVLPPPDLEVLSYLLSRSLHLSSSSFPSDSRSSSASTFASAAASALSSSVAHRSPSFDCGCFDCYTIYWFRWDSSPNRDLIHRIIDDFEDHLSSSTVPPVGKAKVGGGGRRGKDRTVNREKRERMDTSSQESGGNGGVLDGGEGAGPRETRGNEENDAVEIDDSSPGSRLPPLPPSPGVVLSAACFGGGGGEHKGLARKVLPDVLGILNSRLWNLWSPNV